MVMPRVSQALARLVTSKNISQQTRRTLYPHYLRYMVAYPPGTKRISLAENIIVYLGFVVGIFGLPVYIMYDVRSKLPQIKFDHPYYPELSRIFKQ